MKYYIPQFIFNPYLSYLILHHECSSTLHTRGVCLFCASDNHVSLSLLVSYEACIDS